MPGQPLGLVLAVRAVGPLLAGDRAALLVREQEAEARVQPVAGVAIRRRAEPLGLLEHVKDVRVEWTEPTERDYAYTEVLDRTSGSPWTRLGLDTTERHVSIRHVARAGRATAASAEFEVTPTSVDIDDAAAASAGFATVAEDSATASAVSAQAAAAQATAAGESATSALEAQASANEAGEAVARIEATVSAEVDEALNTTLAAAIGTTVVLDSASFTLTAQNTD